jgi:hypothetical protein
MHQSLCIPRMDSSISKDYIHKTLYNLQIGNIINIIEIPLKNDPSHKRAIIRINWNHSSRSLNIQKTLAEIGSIKIVYNMPWYWKIVVTQQNQYPH